MTPEEQAQILAESMASMNRHYVPVDDFVKSFDMVMGVVERNKEISDENKTQLLEKIGKLADKIVSESQKLESRITSTDTALKQAVRDLQTAFGDIKLLRGEQGPQGETGPKGEQGPAGNDGSPDSAEDIRNKLELLSGDERLDRAFIRGLEGVPSQKELEDIKRIAQFNAKPITTTHFYKNGTPIGRAKNINIDTTGSAEVSISGDTATIKVTYITMSDTAPTNPSLHDLWCDIS